MTYGNSTDLGYLVTALADSVSSNLKSYALEVADTWVYSKVGYTISGSTPDLVEKAATYYAYYILLTNLDDTSLTVSATSEIWHKMAEDLLDAYIAQNLVESSDAHPYSSNLTPTHRYVERDIRSTTDDDDDIYNVSEDTWESED